MEELSEKTNESYNLQQVGYTGKKTWQRAGGILIPKEKEVANIDDFLKGRRTEGLLSITAYNQLI